MTVNTHTNKVKEVKKTVIIDNEQPNDEAVVPVHDPVPNGLKNLRDSYEGRKHDPEIDGPAQDSQETDEVYADPRKNENLPAGGKSVADLNAHDLSQEGNKT